ncbi:putative MFS family arabinose efflux permease [Streptomyces sp. 1114.5]|uniref:MFS transporter n=1 Tax=Streptomyces sp. 1114.5 TaxID=1938830 RepID=UPI000EAF18ED|nr:MFS transporter [Streptomyces sp. 1114.5]RKT17252.1 putative MFS family arabinose efflux permease [Streptomyces sp. 1114.5]
MSAAPPVQPVPFPPAPGLRVGRAALAVSFLLQGTTFALLVTCIPEIQRRYGLSDGLLPVFLAAVPILAGVGSITSEQLVKRTGARAVLRVVQPAVCLSLAAAGLGSALWQLALALGAFGLLVGALDASMNMLGVGLQHRYGRSIMIGFHAAFSLGGILGAALAGLGSHYDLGLPVLFGTAAAVIAPLAVLTGTRFAGPAELGDAVREAAEAAARSIPWRPLLPLCLAMAFAYIADASVSNYSVKYLTDGLGSREDLAKLSYLGYMVAMLLGRALGDRAVQRFGAVPVVRSGAALAAFGFGVAAVAPAAWAGIAGFTVLGFGICAIIPQVFAAGGRLFPADSDAAVARLNLFNYVGFLVGSPLVGAIADASSYRWALLAPMLLVLAVLPLADRFAPAPAPAPAVA